MNTLITAAVAALGLASVALPATGALAQPAQATSNSRTSTEEANAQVVTAFYDLAFNQHQPTEAARLYIGDTYIQHNPNVPNGTAPFTGFFEGYFREHTQVRATIHRVIADGDLVAVHVHWQETPQDAGNAIIDIFRLQDGKIVEHFDVIQPVPATTANGNTMFAGNKAD